MKRTRKWAFVEQEATRLAKLGLPPQEIAERIGVNRSSVTRWMATGKLPRTDGEPTTRAQHVRGQPGQTPAQWAETVRREYSLDATDEQLVMLAEQALTMASDSTLTASARMNAAGRFQALSRQLALTARRSVSLEDEKPDVTPAAEPKRPMIQRSTIDPRTSLLQAVK